MTEKRVELIFFFIVFALVGVVAFLIFLPFVTALAVAAVFAVLFYPVYEWIRTRVRARSLASFLTLIIVFLLVFVPLSFLGYLIFEEARSLFLELSSGEADSIVSALQFIEREVAAFIPSFSLDVRSYAEQGLSWVTGGLGTIFSGAAQIILGIFIGFVAMYYFLKDGERFVQAFIRLSPLDDSYDTEIVEKLKQAINAIIRGALVIAVLQGLLAGIGLWVFGIQNPVLWGALAGIGALIPAVGTGIVLVPAVIFLLFEGAWVAAIGLTIWGFIIVGLVDNLIGPYVMGRGVHVHHLFILLSVLGGLAFFGPVGFILGPLVLSLLTALGHIYTLLLVDKKKT